MQSIFVRKPAEASLLRLDCESNQATDVSAIVREGISDVVWSKDGSVAAFLTENGTKVVNGDTLQTISVVQAPHVNAAAFTNSADLLLTHQRPFKENGQPGRNLTLWRWRTGEAVLQLPHRGFSREDWPALHLTQDKSEAFHSVTNTVNCYKVGSASGSVRRLQLKGLGGFAIAPAGQPRLAAFVAEAKGSPGFVGIWDHLALPAGGDPPAPIARRSFFRANQVKLLWASTGKALLALTSSDSDPSNRSYYGDAKLHFLTADGKNDAMLQLKEGPVHDARWAPDGASFAVVAGFMPASTQVFDAACRMVANLGTGSHNLLRWSPQGTFLAVAGFGNLPGDIAFHERVGQKAFQHVGAVRAENGVLAEWAPSGRVLLVATTAPRLRVDNGFTLYRYNGAQLARHPCEVLLDACWRPAAPGAFPDRPSSPGRGPPAAVSAKNGAPAASRGYVPPQLRDQPVGVSSSLHGAPRAAFRTTRLPPGAEAGDEPAKGASKSARKRSKAKGKGTPAEASAASQAENGVDDISAATPSNKEQAEALAQHNADVKDGQETGDAAKRGRALQKKLRQVQQLREKAAAGAKLEPDQLQKLESEPVIIAELQALGLS